MERGVWDSKEGMAINAEVSRACLGLPWIVLRACRSRLCSVGLLLMTDKYQQSPISRSCKTYSRVSLKTRVRLQPSISMCFFARTFLS